MIDIDDGAKSRRDDDARLPAVAVIVVVVNDARLPAVAVVVIVVVVDGGGLNNKNTYHCFHLRRWGQRDRLVLSATAPPQLHHTDHYK